MSFDAGSGRGASSSLQDQSLGPFLRAIGRHWLLVLIVVGLAGGIAVSTIMLRKATYESSASVLVKPLPQGDATFVGIGTVVETVDPTRTIQTAAALIKTPAAAEVAATRMGPAWTGARIQGSLRVEPRGESYVLAITAKGASGPEAARLANTYTTAALQERGKIVQRNLDANIRSLRTRLVRLRRGNADAGQIGDVTDRFEQLRALQALGTDPSFQLAQRGEVPVGAIGTSRALVVMLALIGGLILGSVAALALEFFTKRIRDEDEIARLYPIPILAGIPKIRGVRRSPRLDPQVLSPAAFEQVRLLRVQLPLGDVPTSLTVASANSGDGKTTTASALAMAIALGGEDVILLDLDLRKTGPMSVFNVARPPLRPRGTGPMQLEDLLEAVPGLPRGLRVMPAPLGDALALELFVRDLPDLLSQAKQMASCVIVDSAPVGEVSEALSVAAACDHTVFVVRPRHTDRARFVFTRDMLTRSAITPVGIVVVGQHLAGSSGRYDSYGYTDSDRRQRSIMTSGESAHGAVPDEPLHR